MLLRELATARLGIPEGRLEQRATLLRDRNVRLIEKTRPVDALLSNLLHAIRLLDATGADYWLVRPASGLRFALGCRLSQRDLVIDAIMQASSSQPDLYIRPLMPRPHVRTALLERPNKDLADALSEIKVLRLVRYVAAPESERTFGEELCSEIEFWDDLPSETSPHVFDDELIAPRPGAATRRMRSSEPSVTIPLSRCTLFAPSDFSEIQVEVPLSQSNNLPSEIRFPIDAVYTWVDGNDPEWAKLRTSFNPDEDAHIESASEERYRARDELRYSLRSIHDYAPWIRTIFVVTAGQHPSWLNEHPQVRIVDHRDIFTDVSLLPTFNSHAIESQLHHIDGLSDHFLYFNDDMFLGRPVPPTLFFHGNGIAKYKLSQSRVALGPKNREDTPVDLAVKNSRAILDDRFGVQQAQVLDHSPYPLVKAVLADIESRYAEIVARTASNKFRDPRRYQPHVPFSASLRIHEWSVDAKQRNALLLRRPSSPRPHTTPCQTARASRLGYVLHQ